MTQTKYKKRYELYSVQTPIYEGPLDLLLHLIEKAELDITLLSLSLVTDQYLEYMKHLKELNVDEVSGFLIIAAKLVQIKSEYLLPRQPITAGDEEFEGEDLARQLLIYKRFKEVAGILEAREAAGLHTYLRLAPSPQLKKKYEFEELDIVNIHSAAQLILSSGDKREDIESVVKIPKITIRDKLSHITSYLRKFKSGTFRSLLTRESNRVDIVITFLAMLELIKRHLISIQQNELFSEIMIETTNIWQDEDVKDLEIEFED